MGTTRWCLGVVKAAASCGNSACFSFASHMTVTRPRVTPLHCILGRAGYDIITTKWGSGKSVNVVVTDRLTVSRQKTLTRKRHRRMERRNWIRGRRRRRRTALAGSSRVPWATTTVCLAAVCCLLSTATTARDLTRLERRGRRDLEGVSTVWGRGRGRRGERLLFIGTVAGWREGARWMSGRQDDSLEIRERMSEWVNNVT